MKVWWEEAKGESRKGAGRGRRKGGGRAEGGGRAIIC